ncbi:redoxin domain-containing protein [Roseibacillus persicicus]|nr:redoxin domain-containing protein [Roseibacillus persicicus]
MGLQLTASPLQKALDVQKKDFEDRVTAEKAVSNLKGVDFVRQSGLLQTAKNVGDQAPDFSLPNGEGKRVSLEEMLKSGPVVLTWYRGGWCPYCNIALREYQSCMDEFEKAGVQLVAISPELPDVAQATSEKNELDIEILTDANNTVAAQFGTVMKLAPEIEASMKRFADLKKQNGEDYDEGTLPLAATYLIDQEGVIQYAFLDAEYRNRASVEQILRAVERMQNPELAQSPEMVMRTFWGEVWNPPYNVDLIDSLAAEDFEIISAGKSVQGRDAFKSWVRDFQGKINALRFEIDDLIVSDHKVVTRWTCSGRNNGFFGTEPDQRHMEFTGITITEVKDGRMTQKFVERSAWELSKALLAEEAE